MTAADDQGPVSAPVGITDGTSDAGSPGDSREPSRGGGWRNSRLGQVGKIAISLGLVIAIFWYLLRQFADPSEVWAAIKSLTGPEIAVLEA
jgi:hypothetical protein